jgi:MoxR-like ATPase
LSNQALETSDSIVREVEHAVARIAAVREAVGRVIFGQRTVVDQVLITILAGGHGLLVGVPGLAKTRLVEALGVVLGLATKRIQFTPDLMPGDIVGSEVLEEAESGRRSFRFIKGPVFAQLLMADEINRASPRTQSALLQAMQEHHVTVAGAAYDVPAPFHVLATQNPIEHEGAYPLPEAQLDRFLFKHILSYPSLEEETRIVAEHGTRPSNRATPAINPVLTQDTLTAAVDLAAQTRLPPEVVNYVVRIVRATREGTTFELGASPRAAAMLASAARARAALDGRDYVIPDDVKALAAPALRHRVILSPTAEIEGRTTDAALKAIIEQTEAPR